MLKVIDIDTLQLKREIERLDEFIVQNKMGNNQINIDISQKRIEKNKRNEKNDLQEVNNSSISDADLVILGDSNTKYIKQK